MCDLFLNHLYVEEVIYRRDVGLEHFFVLWGDNKKESKTGVGVAGQHGDAESETNDEGVLGGAEYESHVLDEGADNGVDLEEEEDDLELDEAREVHDESVRVQRDAPQVHRQHAQRENKV